MKIFTLAVTCIILCYTCTAQQTDLQNETARRYADAAQKMYADKNYVAALSNTDSALKSSPQPDANLLYFKIKVLTSLYTVNNDYAKLLETSISDFFTTVDKFSFPEDKYGEVARTFALLQQFKIKDKSFADSATANTGFKDLQTSKALSERITNYLKNYPYTYYQPRLTQAQTKVNNDINRNISYNKKLAQDSMNRQYLKKAGKRTGICFSYAIPNGTLKQTHQSFASADEIKNFFNGSGDVAMGAKFAAGVSIGDIIIPAYTSPIVRISIDWNFLDGEYYQFDWSKETLLDKTKLNVIKAGTRIGPSASFFISKNMSAAVYYSLRPGVQFGIGKLTFTDDKADPGPVDEYIKPVAGNFNLSSEIGAKFRIGAFNINPFYHFGKFNLKSGIYNSSDEKLSDAQCNYKFSYVGLRIGL